MKILFVMDKRPNAGSIQAIANYIRAGDEAGHVIALYGKADPRYPALRFATHAGAFDYVVFVLESGLHWLSGLRMPRLLSDVPRERRAILDADGMYNKLISVDGYDRNHSNEKVRAEWLEYFALMADKIFQPTVKPREAGVRALPFYGFDPAAVVRPERSVPKDFDLLHLAHNWWRWREVSTRLLPALERIRSRLGEVCFMGSWWDNPPVVDDALAVAFRSDQKWLQRLRIQVKPAVDYTQVVGVMSTSNVNVMTQRPLLRNLRLLTSKYFEIFTADTIPLVMLDTDHAAEVYGPAGRELALHNGIEEKLVDVFNDSDRYWGVVEQVRDHLTEQHSYPVRVRQLVEALQN